MTVGLLRVDVFIPDSHSLKDKRRVIAGITDRIRRRFNVSICEVQYQDKWQRSGIVVVAVNTEWRHAQSGLSKIVEHIERERRADILDVRIEQLC